MIVAEPATAVEGFGARLRLVWVGMHGNRRRVRTGVIRNGKRCFGGVTNIDPERSIACGDVTRLTGCLLRRCGSFQRP